MSGVDAGGLGRRNTAIGTAAHRTELRLPDGAWHRSRLTASEISVVTGLLLPIWKRFGGEQSRVFHLQANDGESIIGRRISPAWVANVIGNQAPKMDPDAASSALPEDKIILDLVGGLQLRRVRVMGDHRIEILNFDSGERDRLTGDGLFSEIVQWSYRMLIPADDAGPTVLARMLARHSTAEVRPSCQPPAAALRPRLQTPNRIRS